MFDKCLDPILSHQSWRKGVHIQGETEHLGGHVGRIYEQDGVVCILREDKVETGTGDDVYMQASRSYQLYVEGVRNENPTLIKQGAPAFLLCLLGPMLLICGGFHDMKSTIVEPLAEPCLLFDDILHIRQEALARKLFALKKAVVALCNRRPLDGDTVNHPSAGVPRVYTTYKTEDNREQSLTFSHRLARNHPSSLLFVAIEDPLVPSAEKLVKLAGKYGDGVHRLLAKSQFAPVLYGQRSLEGAPTAYIMEFLSPPTLGKTGWATLFEFFRLKDSATRYSKAIGNTLGRILAVMEEARVVHGDLRPNNLMLEVDYDYTPVLGPLGEEQGANMRVVDFDWA
ncbi:hypothetical protein FRC00_006191, partial [Tulasnella sp. 408]